MCGICGIAFSDATRMPERDTLNAMSHALHHRGPDGDGFVIEPGFGFGHRRLSIIDVAGGAQPMTDLTGQVSMTYNGEIYNFRELRRELEGKGVTFRTRCDAEVLLEGYMVWGIDVVDRIVGMYALGIWDRRTSDLYLIRDRLGVKPLYWTELESGGIAFASELTSLRLGADRSETLNRESLSNYFALSYIPGAESILSGFHRLPPGTFLHWRRGESPRVRTYWNLAEIWQERAQHPESDADVEHDFLDHLKQATEGRLISDVPLGAFLSGGLDSSTICGLIMQATGKLETFSIGFKEESYDELPFAGLMARHLSTDHHEEVVSCESPDLLQEVAAHLDEPFADTSILPTYVLCQAARKRLTVALSGDGGDELLAGYVTHSADVLHGYVSRIPSPLRNLLASGVSMLPDNRSKVGTVFKLKQFMRGAHLDPARAHASWRMLTTPDELRQLVHPDFWQEGTDPFSPFVEAYDEVPGLSPLDRQLYVDYKTWLVDDILTKADRASMAHGLEVRSPFLDHRLIEYCAGLSPKHKLKRFQGKKVLGKVASEFVPQKIVQRSKRGFNSPVSHWIAGPWKELISDVLHADTLQAEGILNGHAVQNLLDEHMAAERDHGFLLFNLLMFRLWKTARLS